MSTLPPCALSAGQSHNMSLYLSLVLLHMKCKLVFGPSQSLFSHCICCAVSVAPTAEITVLFPFPTLGAATHCALHLHERKNLGWAEDQRLP
jgi:hypothetical protein